MVTYAGISRALAILIICAWLGLCVLGCSSGPPPAQPQPAPAQPVQVQQTQVQQPALPAQPQAQPALPQQVPQAVEPQVQQPALPAQPQAQPGQLQQPQAPPAPVQPPQVPQQPPAAINPVGIWESQTMTDYGVMFSQMILQPNGSYSYQVRWGDLMTWEVGLYEVGQGFIHFSVQDYEPKVYKGTTMWRPTSWTVFYTVVDQNTMIWEDRVLGTQWTVYRRR